MNNVFKKMEKRLYDFTQLDMKIKHINMDIENLLNDVSLGGGDMFGEKGSPTNAFNSNVENDVIRREDKEIDKQLNLLNKRKRELIIEKTKLEDALNYLSDDEYKLVKLRYLDRNKNTWVNIAMEMGFDDGYCKKLRTKIITTLINALEWNF